jgi:hypothetical protein
MTTPMIMCRACARLTSTKAGRWKCEAFPGSVPDAILMGEVEHTKSMFGDHGLLYKPRRKPEPKP